MWHFLGYRLSCPHLRCGLFRGLYAGATAEANGEHQGQLSAGFSRRTADAHLCAGGLVAARWRLGFRVYPTVKSLKGWKLEPPLSHQILLHSEWAPELGILSSAVGELRMDGEGHRLGAGTLQASHLSQAAGKGRQGGSACASCWVWVLLALWLAVDVVVLFIFEYFLLLR